MPSHRARGGGDWEHSRAGGRTWRGCARLARVALHELVFVLTEPAGLVRSTSGIAILPMSWKRPPKRTASKFFAWSPSSCAMETAMRCTRSECPAVYGSFALTVAFRLGKSACAPSDIEG